MRTEAVFIPGAKALTPLRQGDLSYLCGLYALVNGIRLALYPARPLSQSELETLYHWGVRFLARRRQLGAALSVGMEEPLWLDLAAHLLKKTSIVTGRDIRFSRLLGRAPPANDRVALKVIRRCVRQGKPALVLFRGALDHYTIISGYSAKRLMLFDSLDRKWIAVQSVGQHHAGSARRHQISCDSAIGLELAGLETDGLET